MTDQTDYDPAEVRAWAAAQGIDVAPGGRLRADLIAAWLDRDGGSEPNWDTAGTAGEDSEGAQDPAPPAAGTAAPVTGTGPPPPADIGEARKRAREDSGGKARARPSWAGRARTSRDKTPPPKMTRQVQGDIEGKLALLLAVPVSTWAAVDPYCGGAAADALDNAVRKAVPLICQSPQAVKWFTEGHTFLLWLDLALALQPVGLAAWQHHVAGTVMLVDGQPVASHRLPSGQVVPVAEPGPRPAPDYSAYTVPGHVPQPRPA